MLSKANCVFYGKGHRCSITTRTGCEGCSFYKTEKQFNESCNRAIWICRKKGLCKNCKYVEKPCELIGGKK